ncbi:MAG: ATPase P [Desulfuromonadaceae bacterium]|nr:ATPase P [Desulfuromonadaceae bacterium]
MLELAVPGAETLKLEHLVLDYNGTLARDGQLLAGVAERLQRLADRLALHVVTADTHGSVARQIADLPCALAIIPPADQALAKQRYLHQLGAGRCAAFGNGRNDALLLRDAALGIALLQQEGLAMAALREADLVCHCCCDALDLLLIPGRLAATLRC